MSGSSEALYAGLSGARTGGANYLQCGVYDLEILRIFRQKSSNVEKAGLDQTIVELRIDKVISAVAARDGWAASNSVGEQVALVVEHSAALAAKMAMGKFRLLLGAALGFDARADAIPAEVCEAVGIPAGHPNTWAALAALAGDGQGDMLAGAKVRAIATPTTTKKGIKIAAIIYTGIPE